MGTQADDSIYFYIPSLAAAILFVILYFIPFCILFWQTVVQYRTWYLLCLPIGALIEVVGYIMRSYSVKNVRDIASYATSSSLIVIAPLFIAAIDYICLGRLILAVLPPQHQLLLKLNPVLITRIFVTSDVFSFLIQCAGSGVASSQNWEGKTGLNLLVAGLALQLATNIVFMLLVASFVRKASFKRQINEDVPQGWNKVAKAVIISITLIFIRSVYRLVEFALGFNGYLFTHEWIFYVLEAVSMLPANAIFALWYPGKHLPKRKGAYQAHDLEVKSG